MHAFTHCKWLLFALVLMLAGCSNDGNTGRGIVQFSDGQRVQSGSIEFRSLTRGDRFASRISSTGGFHLSNQKGRMGLPADDYEVVVVQIVITEDLAAEQHTHGRTVPRRYADYYTSDLRLSTTESDQEPLSVVLSID